MENKSITMLVMSCDAYTDVQEVFFEIWKNNVAWWDYPIYLVTENLNVSYEGVTTIAAKGDSWNERLKYALDVVNSGYILYLQEDYFVGNKISKEEFKKIIDLIIKENLNYYKLDNYPKINNHLYDNKHLSLIPDNKRYGINLLSAIVKVDWLKKHLPKGSANAWEVESSFLIEVKDEFTGYLDGCVVDTREPFNIKYGVRHGKWWPSTIYYFKKNNINIDVSKRGKIPLIRMLLENFETKIAHILPTKLIRILKKILSKLGKKFISEK